MKKILLNALLLASVAMYSCGDDDDDQVCTSCVHSSGSTFEQCGTEADISDMEETWVSGGGTCSRK